MWDPACGGGAFLLAAAEALLGAGHDPADIVGRLLHGTDIDAGAIAVTRAALAWWARRHGDDADPGSHLRVADTLLDPKASAAGPFDLVVGNPPFQSQLAGATVRSAEELEALRERWGPVVAPYTDTAALFLVAGARALADDGRLCMVLPLSVLSARDAAPARHAVEELTDLVGLWVAGEPVFEADVEVCAPVLHRGARSPERSTVARWRGREVAPIAGPTEPDSAEGGDGPARRIGARAGAAGERTWAVHALAPWACPDPIDPVGGRLGELVRTAAGFRDEFYGLVDHVAEAPSELDGLDPSSEAWPEHLAAVVTSGAIDVGTASWGRRTIRFAGRRLSRPVVDRRALSFEVAWPRFGCARRPPPRWWWRPRPGWGRRPSISVGPCCPRRRSWRRSLRSTDCGRWPPWCARRSARRRRWPARLDRAGPRRRRSGSLTTTRSPTLPGP